MGIVEDPWKITATLRAGTGHANAVLGGTVTVTTANGWANFTDLQISHKGSGYIIDFQISYPLSAAGSYIVVPCFIDFQISYPLSAAGSYIVVSCFIHLKGFHFAFSI